MILTYKDHKYIKKIEDLLKKAPVGDVEKGRYEYKAEREILNALCDFRYKEIGKDLINKIRKHFLENDKISSPTEYKFHHDWYVGEPYKTFMDFFTRKLTPKKYKEIEKGVEKCKMIIPNECFIEGLDSFKNTEKIVRLKQKSPDVLKDLKKFDINIATYNYIDMKLLVTYYHRIHMPVAGTIKRMIPIERTDDFFGKNSLWILEIETKKSTVYLLLVGESTIQDFDFLVEKGDSLNIFDTIGYFNWGSQTLIFYDPESYKDIEVKEKTKVFAGDCIFK
jgi:hypothetical protein